MIKRTLTMRIRNGIYVVPMKEILYMEKERRRMRVHTEDCDYYYYTRFEDVLPQLDKRFSRSHRSYIVNLDRIARMEDMHILMDDDTELIFGKATYLRLKREFERYTTWKNRLFQRIDRLRQEDGGD